MYDWSTISYLELELSNHCNSFCPQCPRYSLDGKVKNFPLNHLDFDLIVRNEINTMPNLTDVYFCGGYGDPLMHPKIDDFIEYFGTKVRFITNGSLRPIQWWEKQGSKKISITFCIDGLEDTHSLYRINTSFEKIIANAKAFIESGGTANCQTLVFKHNEHQIEQIKELINNLGFNKHKIIKSDRFYDSSPQPVFVKGNISHYLEESNIYFDEIKRNTFESKKNLINDYKSNPSQLICPWYSKSKLYIDSGGLVFPCCFLGTTDVDSFEDVLFESLISNRKNISLKQKSLKEILASNVFNNYIEERLQKTAHPTCIENCLPGGRRG